MVMSSKSKSLPDLTRFYIPAAAPSLLSIKCFWTPFALNFYSVYAASNFSCDLSILRENKFYLRIKTSTEALNHLKGGPRISHLSKSSSVHCTSSARCHCALCQWKIRTMKRADKSQQIYPVDYKSLPGLSAETGFSVKLIQYEKKKIPDWIWEEKWHRRTVCCSF